MSRIRTVKPELFKHEELFEAEKITNLPLRLAFIGLLTCCDREGRFRWRARQLKLDVLPYDESINFEDVLNALVNHKFIIKYEMDEEYYGCFPSWHKHQRVNNKESESELPSIDDATIISVNHEPLTREPRDAHACATKNPNENSCLHLSQGEGEGEGEGERKGMERNREEEKEGKGDSASQRVNVHALTTPLAIVISIPINSGKEYSITQDQVDQWKNLYPAVDILQELRNMVGWNLANPRRRKTQSGILKHINRWLSKAQNQSTPRTSRSPPTLYEYNKSIADSWINKTSKVINSEEIL